MILGSGSPRRAELLKQLGFEFVVIPSKVDESFPKDLSPYEVAEFVAKKKGTFFSVKENELVITADTVVIAGENILGKPKDRSEAVDMLKSLSDNEHAVVSGVYIQSVEKEISFSEKTIIRFKELSVKEIDFYIDHYAPFDKAGAYGIQEWIGMVAVEEMKGSFYNVVGLPTCRLMKVLSDF